MKSAVYLLEDFYYVMWNTEYESLGWIVVNGQKYQEEISGILISGKVHRIKIPQALLDRSGEYTVCSAKMEERSAYFSKTGEIESVTVAFKGVNIEKPVNIYMVADTHSVINTPSEAGKYFGDALDAVILNGDIMDTSEDISAWNVFFELSYNLTKGSIPIVSTRGNHDTRGPFAPYLGQYCPSRNGEFYFTFTLGDVWGIALDCGEDKTDDHPEYGGTVNFSAYRRRETEYLKNVLKSGEWKKYKRRIAVSHIQPNIAANAYDKEVFDKWMAILNEMDIDIMLCGHDHKVDIIPEGSKCFNGTTAKFPIVVGAKASGNPNTEHKAESENYVGTAVTLNSDGIEIMFTDCTHTVVSRYNRR